MKKIHFGVIKFRKQIVNIIIVGIIGIVAAASIIGSTLAVTTNAVSGVYYNGDTNSKNISLMVNVYWGTEFVEPMLKIFEEKGVKTTFFIGGTWAAMESDTLKKIAESGHELANHGYKHANHKALSEEDNRTEIASTHKIVKELTGVEMTLFAPPSGEYNKVTVATAESLGYKTIMWTRDTIDWRDKDADLIYKRAVKNAKGGDLVLMHPTEKTLEALPRIIDKLQEMGLKIVPVGECIGSVSA